MALRDHFRRPARGLTPWASFHSTWCISIMERLNQQILPVRYRAIPNLRLGQEAQVDVATVHDDPDVSQAQTGNGAVTTAVWALASG